MTLKTQNEAQTRIHYHRRRRWQHHRAHSDDWIRAGRLRKKAEAGDEEAAKGLMVRGELHETETYTDPETGKELTEYSMGAYREDVPCFFDRSREMGYRVCMYAFEQPANHEQDPIGKLINTRYGFDPEPSRQESRKGVFVFATS